MAANEYYNPGGGYQQPSYAPQGGYPQTPQPVGSSSICPYLETTDANCLLPDLRRPAGPVLSATGPASDAVPAAAAATAEEAGRQ